VAEEPFGPEVHLRPHLLGCPQKDVVLGDGQLEVALVVERHRLDLAQRILAVEHPAVRPREQRIGDVADAALDRRAGLGRRPRPLDPLALQVGGNLAADEAAGPGVGDADLAPRNHGVRLQEADSRAIAKPLGAALDARRHDHQPVLVEGRQEGQDLERLRREDVRVGADETVANLQRVALSHSKNTPWPPGSIS
jgi:hypothetical protein